MSKFIIIFIVIILILIFFLYRHGKTIAEHFTSNNMSNYAMETDEYIKPIILSDLISSDLCSKIINQSVNKLEESQILEGKIKSIRNSSQHWINKNDPIIKHIYQKISSMYNIPFENAEDMQVVRYLPNQYYNEHHDSCCDDNIKCDDFSKKSGQRILTVLIYLNNEFTDGQTYFPKLKLKIKPKTGSAIVFYPLAMNSSKCHPLALHAGLPVSSGEKWIANLWFREKKYY